MEKTFLAEVLNIIESFRIANLDLATCVQGLSKIFKEFGYLQPDYVLNATQVLISERLKELAPEHLENLFLMIQAQPSHDDHFDLTKEIQEGLSKY